MAYLLFMAWENDHAPKPPVTAAATASQAIPASTDGSVPAAMAVASSATTSTPRHPSPPAMRQQPRLPS
ncbi:hypothetical protein [Rhodanobacter lindaniclasticus]